MARVMMMGRLADAAGWRTRTFDADTLSALKARILDDAPHFASEFDKPSVSVIVNDVVTRGDAALSASDEVAFLPSMSGG